MSLGAPLGYYDSGSWFPGIGVVPATGATAGTPGTFTPAGSTPPEGSADGMLILVPDPATAWTTGQYVVSGDDTHWYWDGEAWAEGEAPAPVVAATGATAGIPGAFTPAGSTAPADVAGMTGLTASPTTAWTVGQYVQTATAGAAGQSSWSGTAWVAGAAPAALSVSDSTIDEVKAWVEAHPDQAGAVLDIEEAGKGRSTLIAWLESRLYESPPDG